jgi:hypothetical protein
MSDSDHDHDHDHSDASDASDAADAADAGANAAACAPTASSQRPQQQHNATMRTTTRRRRPRDTTTRRRNEIAVLRGAIAELELQAGAARARNAQLRRELVAHTVAIDSRGVMQHLGVEFHPQEAHGGRHRGDQPQQQQQQQQRRVRRSPRALAPPVPAPRPAAAAAVAGGGGEGGASGGSEPGSATSWRTPTTTNKTTATTTSPAGDAAAVTAAVAAAATRRVFLPPEHHDMLEASVFGMLAREYDGGGAGGSDNDNSSSNTTTTIVARASAVLAALVAERRERALRFSTVDYLRHLRDFNFGCALALWRASAKEEEQGEQEKEEEEEQEEDGRRACGRASSAPSSSSPSHLDAELNALVKDRVGWVAALGRYQDRLQRHAVGYNIETQEPLSVDGLELEREDAQLREAAARAKFSPAQLSMLAVLYEQRRAAVGRGDRALCEAFSELSAALGVAPAPPPPPRAEDAAATAAAASAAAAPPLISQIERALADTLTTAGVATGALFQTINPRQYAILNVALYPRVTPFLALLRAGWLLHRAREGEEPRAAAA